MKTYYKPVGGVARVVLCRPSDDMEIAFDEEGCTAVFNCEGVGVTLLDDRSSFEECASPQAGAVSVVHTLTLVASRNAAAPWLAPDFIMRATHEGLVADITLNDGRRLLCGCSEALGSEQPLRLVSLRSDSCCRLSQTPALELTLRSEDTAFACENRVLCENRESAENSNVWEIRDNISPF